MRFYEAVINNPQNVPKWRRLGGILFTALAWIAFLLFIVPFLLEIFYNFKEESFLSYWTLDTNDIVMLLFVILVGSFIGSALVLFAIISKILYFKYKKKPPAFTIATKKDIEETLGASWGSGIILEELRESTVFFDSEGLISEVKVGKVL